MKERVIVGILNRVLQHMAEFFRVHGLFAWHCSALEVCELGRCLDRLRCHSETFSTSSHYYRGGQFYWHAGHSDRSFQGNSRSQN
jgi:hypothetical protein